MLVECLPDENFDDTLSTDVKLSGGVIEFIQHILGEVYIDALNRRHHSTCVSKIARDVLATLGPLCDRVGSDGFFRLRVFFMKFSLLFGCFPECDQVVVLAVSIFSDLEDYRIQFALHQSNGPDVPEHLNGSRDIRMRPDFLDIFESNAASRILPYPSLFLESNSNRIGAINSSSRFEEINGCRSYRLEARKT
jgi:hypothetical protein